MCIICLELDKLNLNQAISNLFETRNSLEEDHVNDVLNKIYEKMDQEDTPLTEKSDRMLLMIEDGVYPRDLA